MKTIRTLTITLGALGAIAALSSGQDAPQRTGPGVQAFNDAKEPELLKTCKTPPPARGGRGRGAGRGAAAQETLPRDYTVTEIPGVIAAGQKWTEVWSGTGNNADGPIATKDGGLLIAQNDNSDIMKLDKNGKTSVVYSGLNTSGAISMNTKGMLFANNRGMSNNIEELLPERKNFANKYNGEPLDCTGGLLNDLSADSKGGVYFTTGALYYANPKGEITKYGDNLTTNGIILSRDEKTLYVTNGMTIAAFDVQKDGSLTNQREFAKLEGGGTGDGSTIDSAGRLYVSSQPGVQVFSPEGKYLGLIPTPRPLITVAFSGKDKKTLYAIANNQREDHIMTIQMIAQGFKGRAK